MKKFKNNKYLIGALIITIFLLIAGLSYAYFSIVVSGNEDAKNIVVQNTTLRLVYTDTLEITANDIYPEWTTTKTISVENTGTSDVYYALVFQNLTNTLINNELKISATCTSNNGTCNDIIQQPVITITTGKDVLIQDSIFIKAGEKQTYTITIEFIETGDIQNYNQGKVFTGVLGVREGTEPVLGNIILLKNTTYKTVDEAKTAIEAKPEPTFSNPADTAGESGIFATPDLDGGTSYYYRGIVNDNFIKFGKEGTSDICWRIVRINGDGSTRIIYTGKADASGNCPVTGASTGIPSIKFNTNYNKPEYSGYMYGDMTGTTVDEKLASWRTNTHSSNAKTEVEAWYKTNFIDNTANQKDSNGNLYSSYIYDSPFCGERNVSSGDFSSSTYYYPYKRQYTNKKPSLLCGGEDGTLRNKADVYTANDTNIGNGALDYPVGLITTDEAMFAGGGAFNNSTYYLNTNTNYWTLSARTWNGSFAYVGSVYDVGSVNYSFVGSACALRPVLNLSSEILVTGGTGTATDAYTIIK